jgi:hypothetical protein
MYSKDGVYKNGEWFKVKVFPLTETGWSIPNNIGRSHAGVEN